MTHSSAPLEVTLQQGWRTSPEPGFQPTTVRLYATPELIRVEATLTDADIVQPETGFNQPAFRCGDTFELFFRPLRQDAYLELHVGPANQVFQLRIPSAEIFAASRQQTDPWRAWLIPQPCFESRAWTEPAHQRWHVHAHIPTRAIAEQPAQAGDRWLCSFSRYDYARGRPTPILSSSSPHRELNFHLQQEWNTLVIG